MRISTGMIFDAGLGGIQRNTSTLLRTQQQISSGRRILTPSDDPVAAASAMEVTQSQGVNKQYQSAQDDAKGTLGIMDSQLSSTTDLLARIRELTVQGGNAALSAADRQSIATELRARFDELVGLGNSTDGTGQYLFSGYQGSNKPFAGSVENGVTYAGDDGQRTLRVAGSRNLPISASGNDIFMSIKNGNGVFATGIQSAKSSNIHTVGIDNGTITNSALWGASGNPDNVELRFWVDSAGGGVNTQGFAAGNVSFANIATSPVVIDSTNNTFSITLDGGAATDVTVAQATYTDAASLMTAVQNGIDAAYSPAASPATVTLDANNNLVVTSNTQGAGSSASLAQDAGLTTNGFAALFSTNPAPLTTANGGVSVPGQTFYDLVDKATGNSLFTGTASDATAGGTFTHAYSSGSTIPLFSSGASPFNLGAMVRVTGTPATGDTFTVDRVNPSVANAVGSLVTSPATITHTNAVIDKGIVTDPVKWTATANKQDMEVRFWVDSTGAIGAAGATYYDLVGADGNSLYTGKPSATGAGGTYTHPYASVQGTLTGAVDLSAGVTIVAGGNDTLNLTINGVPRSVTIPAGFYPLGGGPGDLQTTLGALLAPYGASVGASGNNLLITSNSANDSSAVTLTLPVSNGAAALLGAATTGPSQPIYGNPTTIDLKGTGATPFDYGASVTITGNPADGDTFTIKGSNDPALGNGYFITAAKTTTASNMGSGIIGSGEVLDQSKWDSPYNSRQLEVRFWKDPKDTRANAPVYYDLVDARTEKSLFTDTTSTSGGGGNTYTHTFKSGDPIAFSGLASPYKDFGVTATIDGTPASGDVFTLQSSVSQSVFETVGNLINALESPIGPVGSNSNAELQNKLGFALTSIAAAGDNIDRVRADVGTRLAEVDDLSSVSQNLELQYSSTLSTLQDVDYAKAITDLTRMQAQLQAAQQSFVKVSQLSLFNYL